MGLGYNTTFYDDAIVISISCGKGEESSSGFVPLVLLRGSEGVGKPKGFATSAGA